MQDVAPEEAKILQQRAVLRCHCERKMTDYRANGMLMPVINGIVRIRAACVRFQQGQLTKVNFIEGSWLRVVAFAGAFGSAALLSAGKPKLAATIPNKRCGQK